MSDQAKRYFTVREVDALVPTLEALMARLMRAHAEAGRLRKALETAQRQVVLAGGTRLRPEWWRSRRAAIGAATRDMRARLGELLATGGTPKDLELGLVDFPARVAGREVNLCWRLGEKRVRYWHGLNEGYAGRKPIPESEGEG
jgi:hypothetical protein